MKIDCDNPYQNHISLYVVQLFKFVWVNNFKITEQYLRIKDLIVNKNNLPVTFTKNFVPYKYSKNANMCIFSKL